MLLALAWSRRLYIIDESDINGTRSTVFRYYVICLGKTMRLSNSYRLYNKEHGGHAKSTRRKVVGSIPGGVIGIFY
jgi:hypothetical protein